MPTSTVFRVDAAKHHHRGLRCVFFRGNSRVAREHRKTNFFLVGEVAGLRIGRVGFWGICSRIPTSRSSAWDCTRGSYFSDVGCEDLYLVIRCPNTLIQRVFEFAHGGTLARCCKTRAITRDVETYFYSWIRTIAAQNDSRLKLESLEITRLAAFCQDCQDNP